MKLFAYKELFRIVIEHDYYTTTKSADFSFTPTKETEKLFLNHGLLFKPMNYGFGVFGKVENSGGNAVMELPFSEKCKLTFIMKLVNPVFMNFTDIALNPSPHSFFYFNNLSDHSSSGDLLLADKAEIPKTSGNANRMTMIRSIYNYTRTGSNATETGTITFPDSGSTIEKTLENYNNTFPFQFELSGMKPGRAAFAVDSINESFYLGNELYTKNVFGIIEIFANTSVPADYKFVDGTNMVTPREYKISFTNRSTMWRYFVYDKVTNTLDSPEIAMAGTKFKRDFIPTSSYPEEYSLYTFTSGETADETIEKPLPLKEEPVQNITLSGIINGGGRKDLVVHLPNPDVSLIKPLPQDTSRIYSDLVIYV